MLDCGFQLRPRAEPTTERRPPKIMPKKVDGTPTRDAAMITIEPAFTFNFLPESCKIAPTKIMIPQPTPITNRGRAAPEGTDPRPSEE